VLVTVDTLRADHCSYAGESPVDTPALDALARQGASAGYAVAPFGRTTQSVGTILTGLHPLRHGADGLDMVLPSGVETLAERFREEGYLTAAFVSNLVLRPGRGFEQGFDIYTNPRPRWIGNSAEALTDEALAWLHQARESGKPLFLWVHYLDPHWPYTPPAKDARRAAPDWPGDPLEVPGIDLRATITGRLIFEAPKVLSERSIDHLRDLYAAEVAATDRALGRLIDGLAAGSGSDAPVVLVTADHGESLGEHEYWFAHGEYVYEPSLRVPFLVRAPGKVPPETRIGGVVRLADVAPTLLELAGLGGDALAGDGVSLVPRLVGESPAVTGRRTVLHLADHRLVREENPRRPVAGREGRWTALRQGGYKLIRIPLDEETFEHELYDLATDPGERHNLISEEPQRAERMSRALDAELERLGTVPERAVDGEAPSEDVQEALRSLGYLE
jgi:arylsulfatase A-like enzyme